MRLSDNAIMHLAALCVPFLEPMVEIHGQLTPDLIRDALRRIGRPTVCSDRTVHMIDQFISNGFV